MLWKMNTSYVANIPACCNNDAVKVSQFKIKKKKDAILCSCFKQSEKQSVMPQVQPPSAAQNHC
jgi:hypothetical protein